jgi:hypothetical protein
MGEVLTPSFRFPCRQGEPQGGGVQKVSCNERERAREKARLGEQPFTPTPSYPKGEVWGRGTISTRCRS